jgi:hypothetical protein
MNIKPLLNNSKLYTLAWFEPVLFQRRMRCPLRQADRLADISNLMSIWDLSTKKLSLTYDEKLSEDELNVLC